MSHSIPRKSNTATVFEWQPQDKFDSFLLRIRLTKAQTSTTWGNYNRSTRIYDSFHNEWDLCDVLDPTSIPDSDWEEDHFLPDPAPSGPPLPPPLPLPPPPPLSSFIQDIENYFCHHEVAPSLNYTHGPDSSLSASNANIRVSYIHMSKQQLLYVIQLCPPPSLVPWNLVVPDAAMALMCLCHNWGYDIVEIARNLLQKGIAFKTLLPMAVLPCVWCPVMELCTYLLGYKPPTFSAVYADYVMYEQYHHEFMNQPHARAALLHGGLIWWLALHSIGFDALLSVLNGISQEAVPFGLMLSIDGQTYFDNKLLLEEEVDFICGMYYIYNNAGNVGKISW
ncbi:hypothetical protein BDR05DRAFT_996001 [Suillus weaverae]|nr:hypothetical protein BDR05DRAFT_996001 [Suillus weaverae]